AELPLTTHGKIDKKALKGEVITESRSHYIAPIGQIETTLTTIWSQLLNIAADTISRDGNFFELGGHSLLSVRLLAEIRKSCAKEITVRDIFACPQLYHLAEKIQSSTQAIRPSISSIKQDQAAYLASFAQQRLWFIDQMDGGSAHYNMPTTLYLQGDFKVKVAEQAFKQIISRHEPLRTVFINADEGPLQVIQKEFDFKIGLIDLSKQTTAEQKQSINTAIKQDAQRSFDLSQDLMLRVNYLTINSEQGILLFNVHHIASDGWSNAVLIDEFVQLYRAILKGKTPSLQSLSIQYKDYAQWQHDWLDAKTVQKQLDYWHKQLKDIPVIHSLPLDFERPVIQTFNGALYDFELDQATLRDLKAIALDKQVTLFMLVHAAFSILLSRYSNNDDIVVATPVANRMQKELEPLIGFFVNTLILRVDCSENMDFNQFLDQIKAINIDAQQNQDIPFEHLVDHIKPTRSTSHNALFQILFSMDTNEASELNLPKVKLSNYNNDEVTAKFDLSLFATDVQKLTFTFEYNSDLFKPQTIASLAQSLCVLLREIAKNTQQKIKQLPLLNSRESTCILEKIKQNTKEYPQKLCIHQLLEQQAQNNPDLIALVF
ncbi:MAG TPA: non-ribosomal peptide synthetase, partial [Oceanospirillales bacterium]|nr:non-ribosomal peptide synthetase [Oceanospirillales bacterium]